MHIAIVQEFLSKRSTRLTRLQHKAVSSGGFRSFTGLADGTNFKASGGVQSPSPAAQPYIININNTNNFPVSNFTILNGNVVGNPLYDPLTPIPYGYQNGDYIKNGVRVSSVISGVTYQSFVNQSQTQPFNVGTTVITANNGVNAQVNQPFIASTTDASGLTQGIPVTLLKDPFQSQRDMIVCTTPYQIDGTAALTITNVLANANFNIYFYPTQNVNNSNILSGQSSVVNMQKPKLINALNVVSVDLNVG